MQISANDPADEPEASAIFLANERKCQWYNNIRANTMRKPLRNNNLEAN